jgi:hypothetical protein
LPNFSQQGAQTTHQLRKDLRALRRPALIVFDSYEDVAENKTMAEWLSRQFLNEIETAFGLAVIVAGQMVPDLANTYWRELARHLRLEPVTDTTHYGQRPDSSSKTTKAEPHKVFVSYAWGNTSPNASKVDRQRQEVVERLCRTLEKEHWQVVRDKTTIKYGEQISDFMKKLGQSNLVIVVLSAKYLHSLYCMTELYDIYRQSLGEKEAFLRRIIPVVLKDAHIDAWRAYAEYWETEFKAMEQHLTRLGEEDFKLYGAMKRWHNEVGNMPLTSTTCSNRTDSTISLRTTSAPYARCYSGIADA